MNYVDFDFKVKAGDTLGVTGIPGVGSREHFFLRGGQVGEAVSATCPVFKTLSQMHPLGLWWPQDCANGLQGG